MSDTHSMTAKRQLLSLIENLYEDVRSIERREVTEVYKLVDAIEAEARSTPAEALPERPSIEDEWYEQDSGGGDDSAEGAALAPAQIVTSLPRPSSGCRHQWTHIGGYPDEPEELAYDKCLGCGKVKGRSAA